MNLKHESSFNPATLARLRDIALVLSRYGLRDIADKLRLPMRFSFKRTGTTLTTGQKVKAILEELGPTYIKLGQVLSGQTDVLPVEIVRELEQLQEKVEPFPFAQVEEAIARTIETPLTEAFAEFADVPIAAASLSQVHRARLTTGEEVAVKVQRPGLEETIRGDLSMQHLLARLLHKHVPELRIYDLPRLVSTFERSIEKEIDFRLEGDNYERFRQNFVDDPGVYFPKVYRQHSGRDVLTLEYIHGEKIDSLLREDSSHDRSLVAERGVNAAFKQIFEDGFFHADPHQGNLIIMEHDVVCFIDVGMVGVLDREARDLLDRLLVAVAYRDVPSLVSVILIEDMIPEDADLKEFQADLEDLFDRYHGAELEDVDLASGLGLFNGLIRKHRIRMPANFVLLARCLIILEGIGRRLEPGFNPARSLMPYARRALQKDLQPTQIVNNVNDFFRRNAWLMKTFPGDLVQFLARIVRGKAEFRLDHRGFEEISLGVRRASSRLAAAILAAGTIIASSLIIRSDLAPLVQGVSLLGLIGYAASLSFAVAAFVRIYRDIK